MKILFSATVISHIKSFHVPYIKYFLERGHHVSILANNDSNETKQLLTELGCQCFDVNISRNPFSKSTIIAYSQILKHLKNHNYDLITTHTPIMSLLIRRANHKLNKNKIMYTAHGFHFHKEGSFIKNIIFKNLEKRASKYTDALLVMNDDDLEAAKSFNAKKVFKINGIGVDLYEFGKDKAVDKRKELGVEDNELMFVYIAEMSERKNQEFLLRNWKKISQEHPEYKLFLIGKGSNLNKYQKYIQDNNLKNVSILGFRTDVKDLIYSSDGVVLLSEHEGLPRCLLEGMALGKALIVSDIRGNNDLTQDAINGFKIKLNNDEMLFDTFDNKIKSRKNLYDLGQNNLNLVNKYSLENVLKEHEVIYKSLLGDKL